VQATLRPQFLVAGSETRNQFRQILKADNVHWSGLIKTYGVKE
jgi:hypothetical protein